MPSLLGSEEHTSELQSPCNLVCRLFLDRKSTRLNSSHLVISYAVFCLKKKTNDKDHRSLTAASVERPGGYSVSASSDGEDGAAAFWFFFFFLKDGAPPDLTPFPPPAAFPV